MNSATLSRSAASSPLTRAFRADRAAVVRAAERELCGRSLSEFVRAAWPVLEPGTEYLPNWHIDYICEHLEAVTRGEITRLLVNMPPRYMKSLTVSVFWPCWEWTGHPETRWMFASYSKDLSTKHSVDRRQVIQSGWYQDRWGQVVRLSDDANLKTEFMNDSRGVMLATSIGGTATGKGGDRVVVDDPHNPQQAESDVERKGAVTFFDRTLSNRLDNKRTGAIVVVMQRLHEEDVSARCLELGYTHLKLPAEASGRTVVAFPSGREVVREDGELLWPAREGPAEIKQAKAAMGSYAYAGQYDQEPAPPGGGMIKSVWFEPVDAAPVDAAGVRYWDKAGTDGGGDFTCGVLMRRRHDGIFYICDVVRGQWSAHEREKRIRATAEQDGRSVAIWVEQEPGSGGKESAANTVINLAGWNVHAEPVTGDKAVRARPFAAQAEAGNVRIVRAPWVADFNAECDLFPMGKHDDQVDAASGAFNKLALVKRPPAPGIGTGRRPPLVMPGHHRHGYGGVR
jgi:predicted phage terminase large subunit-like protein